MNGFLKHPMRVAVRLSWLAGEIVLALLDFVVNVIFQPKIPLLRARAQWLQQACRRILRVLNVEVKTQGQIPLKGLLVCNHLSYVDVLVIGTITPAVFVCKSEVKSRLVFRWFARLAGTIFVERSRRADVTRLNRELGHVLDAGGLVVLFPEGTTSDGRDVLPFKSPLLEPALRLHYPLSVAFIGYRLPDGNVSEDICYWGDMTLAPHLANLCSKERIRTHISFTQLEPGLNSRKELAAQLHSQVLRLKQSATERALV